MSTRRHFIQQGLVSAAVGAGLATPLHQAGAAAAWPRQPLRIVIPFAAGGTSDVIARLISKPLSDALGQPVVIENRTGASGNLGAGVVAMAGDGHTMLLSDLGALAVSPLVAKDLPFKPEQLKGVTMLAYSPHILAVHPSVPANNITELVAWSKKQRVNVASSGSGTPNHLGVVDIALTTGLNWQHVPYRGGGCRYQRHRGRHHPHAAQRHGGHVPAGAGRQAQAHRGVQAHAHGGDLPGADAGGARRDEF